MQRRTVAPQDPSSATGPEPARRSDSILPAEAFRRRPPLPSLVAHFGVGSRGVLDPHRRFARIQYHTCGPGSSVRALPKVLRYAGHRDVLDRGRRRQLAREDDRAIPDRKATLSVTIGWAETESPVEHRAIAHRHDDQRDKGADRRVGRQRRVRWRKHQMWCGPNAQCVVNKSADYSE